MLDLGYNTSVQSIKNFLQSSRLKQLLPYFILLVLFVTSYVLYIQTGYITLSVISGLGGSYFIFRRILSPKLFQSKLFVAVTSLVAYTGLLQIVTYVARIFIDDLTLLASPSISQLLLSAGVIGVLGCKAPKIPMAKIIDIAALAAALLFIGMTSILPLRHAENTGGDNAIALINVGPDDSAHISILNDRLQYKKAVITEAVADGVARHNHAGYPAGWHNANAIFILSINPTIQTGYDSMVAYIISKLFWVGLLVYLLGSASAFLLTRSGRKWLASYWVFLSSLLFAIWFIADSMETGFYNYLGILTTIPLGVLAMAQLAASRSFQSSLWGLVLPICLTATITLSWLLVAPILIIASLLFFLRSIKPKDVWNNLKNKQNWIPLTYVVFLVAILALSFVSQLRLTQIGTENLGFVGTLLVPGGIAIYPTGLYVALLAGCAPFFYLLLRSKKAKDPVFTTIETTILLLTIAFGFTACIYMIQQYYAKELSYYFYKTLNISLFIVMVIVIAGTTRLIAKSSTPPLLTAGLITLSILGASLTLYPEPRFVNYVRNNHHTTPAVSKLIEAKLRTTYSQKEYLNNSVDVVMTPKGYPVIPQIAIYLLRTNKPYSTCYQQAYEISRQVPSEELVADYIKKLDCDEHTVTIYVDNPNLAHVRQVIDESRKQNFIAEPIPQS